MKTISDILRRNYFHEKSNPYGEKRATRPITFLVNFRLKYLRATISVRVGQCPGGLEVLMFLFNTNSYFKIKLRDLVL